MSQSEAQGAKKSRMKTYREVPWKHDLHYTLNPAAPHPPQIPVGCFASPCCWSWAPCPCLVYAQGWLPLHGKREQRAEDAPFIAPCPWGETPRSPNPSQNFGFQGNKPQLGSWMPFWKKYENPGWGWLGAFLKCLTRHSPNSPPQHQAPARTPLPPLGGIFFLKGSLLHL